MECLQENTEHNDSENYLIPILNSLDRAKHAGKVRMLNYTEVSCTRVGSHLPLRVPSRDLTCPSVSPASTPIMG